jgi:hypothetical protein
MSRVVDGPNDAVISSIPPAASPGDPDLYRGFEGYRTPTNYDYERVITSGMVVPDTNVLLNLYRYNMEAQTDLLAVLRALGDRLWVPHQVLVEFWRNRESAIRDPQDSADSTIEALESHLADSKQVLRSWGNRVAASSTRVNELVTVIEEAFRAATDAVSDSVDPEEIARRRDTNNDAVLGELQAILQGRVGAPLSQPEHDAAVQEGLRRIDEKIPPGFGDKGKPQGEAAGDYLIWEQVLREAARRRCDVLLVTGDVKDDWWRRERGESRGPRLELVSELRQTADAHLYMLRPESLLRYAKEFLDVEVSEESVQDAERVASLLEQEHGAWTTEALILALEWLDVHGPVQALAVRAALEQGGFVARDVVYQLGGYDEGRTLRGFTRPANRITQDLRDRGMLGDSAPDLLRAVYDPQISYVQASGFRVPAELVTGDTATRSDPEWPKPMGTVANTSAATSKP